MKFSVLLPTRNRLEFLKYAIDSVIKQSYDNWEIIVSDNDSHEDIHGYVQSLNNPKVKYFRTNSFVSVTENWNNTIEHSSGDYIIMLGDDDCLMRGYFETILQIISEFEMPELIYSNAFLYAYPGVLPKFPQGYFRTMGNCALWDRKKPFLLDKKSREHLLKETYGFKVAFSYNMQFGTIRRDFVNRIRYQGKFFHSPYPDYYAMTLMMEKANTVVACPEPIVTVGITPKSFGYFYYNKKESEGIKFLNNREEFEEHPELSNIILPGADMNTCWLVALNSVQKSLGRSVSLNYNRYRLLQLIEFTQMVLEDEKGHEFIRMFLEKCSGIEKVKFKSYIYLTKIIRALLGRKGQLLGYKVIKKILNSHPVYPFVLGKRVYKNIQEVFDKVDPKGRLDAI
jgi:glycosyltransferase involved in cell wall biosynthesis